MKSFTSIEAQRIAIARKHRDISQVELAKRIGANPQLITKLENDRREIDTKILRRIAEELEFPMTYFVADEDEAREIFANVVRGLPKAKAG